MKNQFIIPSIIIAASILGGFWMLKSQSEPQKVTIVPQPPEISIHDAARNGNIKAVKQHLAARTDVNAKDEDGQTPLHAARKKEIAELLIAAGSDVNAVSVLGNTPLHVSAYMDNKEVAEVLIAKGADVNAKVKGDEWKGSTPLDYAIRVVSTKTADLLRKHGGKTG